MLRSMYAGVSGLKAHMNKMDIVGNNISNVNTTGYKGSRATFKTMLSQTIQGASAPQDERGGTNPQQIGLGVTLGSIDKDMGQGNLQSTGRNTDLAIQGNGFFVLNGGGSNLYTRAGALSFDKEGYLVNATNGYRLQGWQADANGDIDTNAQLEDLTLNQSMEAQATDEVTYGGNLDADVTPGTSEAVRTTTVDVFDSQGTMHTVQIDFEKTSSNTWEYNVADITQLDDTPGSDPQQLKLTYGDGSDDTDSNGDGVPDLGAGVINFDASGEIADIDGGADNPILQFNPSDGAAPVEVELDFSSLTQFSDDMTANYDTVNGYQAGAFENFSIGQSGVVTGHYDNGKRQILGQIALANFNNPAGLNEESDTMFRTSNNSGEAKIGTPNAGGFGQLKAGTIEMSNVDLSREFTEMITTQRGFQANSKTISTSDQILQELVNLKR